jgi:hypothetical protein
MVIEMEVGSLQKLPFGDVVEDGTGCGQGRRFGFVTPTVDALNFFFIGSADDTKRPAFSYIWRFSSRVILILRIRRPAFCDSIEIKKGRNARAERSSHWSNKR